ncbi:hypothetical protein BDV93DRAFT_336193 [Ceratobasidium sp. AG-I]|nr:hypothetical protein BDV93DRAFT_336193 [Ceratobasidium sp. AG-I]
MSKRMDGLRTSPIGSMKPYLVVHAREVPLPAGLHTDAGLFVLHNGDPRRSVGIRLLHEFCVMALETVDKMIQYSVDMLSRYVKHSSRGSSRMSDAPGVFFAHGVLSSYERTALRIDWIQHPIPATEHHSVFRARSATLHRKTLSMYQHR